MPYFMLYYIFNILNHLNWLPTNNNISYKWNGGSFLGLILMGQILSGLLLTLIFTPTTISFWNLLYLTEEINMIFLVRVFHANGASLFFLLIFFHMARGLYVFSFKKKNIWLTGVSIYIILMAVAFLGYVLPWGQMSLWGGTVITNLFSVFSSDLVLWIWGNFSVSSPTLPLFFSLHFILPFILFVLVFIHIIFLHETGSSSKIFISNFKNKFFDFYLFKDFLNIFIFIFLLFAFFWAPWSLGDPENFIEANALLSPLHIKPEWYFLWAYAILRAIPSKAGGVAALFSAVLIIYFLPMKNFYIKPHKIIFMVLIISFILLTFLGGMPVEPPFIVLSQLLSCIYFLFIVLYCASKYW